MGALISLLLQWAWCEKKGPDSSPHKQYGLSIEMSINSRVFIAILNAVLLIAKRGFAGLARRKAYAVLSLFTACWMTTAKSFSSKVKREAGPTAGRP
jgi:hypothetical protein